MEGTKSCNAPFKKKKETTLLWCLWKLTQQLPASGPSSTGCGKGGSWKEEEDAWNKLTLKNKCVPDLKGWRHLRQGRSTWSLPGDWWKQSFLTYEESTWIWSVALRDLQTKSNSCCFLDSSLLLPVLIPMRSPAVAKGRAQPAAGVTQLHPVGLGGADPSCLHETESHKRHAEGKAQAVWADAIYSLRGRYGEVITTCSFLYTPARHIYCFTSLNCII